MNNCMRAANGAAMARSMEANSMEVRSVQEQSMNANAMNCADEQGRLPACAPLANPYVPFQQEGSEQYQADFGLIRGTIFPGLDLPYMGLVNTQVKNSSVLSQVQALGFAITELGLYLDTHQNDSEAVALFNQYAEMYEEAVQQYQQEGGELTQLMSAQSGAYRWLEQPWPWEYREED